MPHMYVSWAFLSRADGVRVGGLAPLLWAEDAQGDLHSAAPSGQAEVRGGGPCTAASSLCPCPHPFQAPPGSTCAVSISLVLGPHL